MHLLTILSFALLFWRAEGPADRSDLSDARVAFTLSVILGQVLIIGLVATLSGRRALNLLHNHPSDPDRALQFHHRATLMLRILLFAGHAFAVLGTSWPRWFNLMGASPAIQIFGDLGTLTPFFVNILIIWLAAFPFESAVRKLGLDHDATAMTGAANLRLRSYLDFNLRHNLLVVAVPMTLILIAGNLTRGHAEALRNATGWIWAPDLALGTIAALVFLIAPWMLKHIWRTSPLEPGPLRERLEQLCAKIGLKCRDILVWHSDGIMINAAVMGLLPPVRYVLLSDALLRTMNPRQVEAVFGHEAGHVRHHHIPHFLVLAFVGWLAVTAFMESLARWIPATGASADFTLSSVQGVGVAATALFWIVGFGWVSRRFERQADVYGARCVTPASDECGRPCSVHLDADTGPAPSGRLCATAAATFASALDRVALLNGIPREERSWRHSSIGSRVRFLSSLAGDPNRAGRFDRLLRRIKLGIWAAALAGTAIMALYWYLVPEPALLKLYAGG